MRLGILFFCVSLACTAFAQVPDVKDQGYTLALPTRPGRLHLDAPSFAIVEASAKPSGTEFGLRGQDRSDSVDLLVFLFRYPEEAPLTNEKCRDSIIRHLKESSPRLNLLSESILSSEHGSLALAQYSTTSSNGQWLMVRAFAASSDLCADIEFSTKHAISVETPVIKEALNSISFNPDANPNFQEVYLYATTLYEHKMMKAAAPIYEKSLTLLPANDPTGKWRRVATDQAVMAYGISGDIAKARSLLDHAIKTDPGYPLNYYNLACADAEEGDARAARIHLQQAFDKRGQTIPGESLPDPTQDDSLLKLKKDQAFWTFVEHLQKNR
jgi:tetratricopeptide (TPR) repeat protein